ncbi:MAG: DUF86 domain-containing protein [Chloroflexi bacterium]|nr:DUF86 domain-containing protein [Chloroflexota bacterium]
MEDAGSAITSRLRLLAEYADELREYRSQATNLALYTGTKMLRRSVERCLQVTVEVCLDIGRRLIALEGFRFPHDNQDVFKVLAEEKVVSALLLIGLQDFARFRNLIVHDYARIDDGKVYQLLKTRLDDFDAFADAVSTYLET